MFILRLIRLFLASIGRSTLELLGATGRLAIFAAVTISHLVRPPYYPAEFGGRCCASASSRCPWSE